MFAHHLIALGARPWLQPRAAHRGTAAVTVRLSAPLLPIDALFKRLPLLHLKASSSGSDQSPCHYSLQRKLFMGLQR
ncbi:hypothetical protein NQZ68_019828 [Dissostichus eleginoides]|nr:hypothetical protein NQZ68_019828 [Dissostichus eleginoides]